MARLVPEVIVVVHAIGFVFPTTRYVELLVKQQETTGSVAFLVTEHREHHLTIGEAVNGVRRSEIHLFFDLFRFDHLMQLWGSFIRDIYNMNTTRQVARKDEKASRFTFISIARATGIPAKMVELVADVGHGCSVDHLRIGWRCRINIDSSQIIRFFDPCSSIECDAVEHLFGFGLHGLCGRSVPGSALGMIFMMHCLFICHAKLSPLIVWEDNDALSRIALFFASDKHHSSTWLVISSHSTKEEIFHYVFPMS